MLETRSIRVPGASLYCEVRGSGPSLVLMPGGNGDMSAFEPLATILANRFRVVVYQRRGFSRSPMDGALEADRVPVDSRDLRTLIEYLGGVPVSLLAMSAGAVVILDFLPRYPEYVTKAVAHEPPLATLLDDAPELLSGLDEAYALYFSEGLAAGLRKFARTAGLTGQFVAPVGEEPSPEMRAERRANSKFWVEHEMRQMAGFTVDIDALRTVRDKLILACGGVAPESMAVRPARVLADALGVEVLRFPGGHWGHASHPEEFARVLAGALSEPEAGRSITNRKT